MNDYVVENDFEPRRKYLLGNLFRYIKVKKENIFLNNRIIICLTIVHHLPNHRFANYCGELVSVGRRFRLTDLHNLEPGSMLWPVLPLVRESWLTSNIQSQLGTTIHSGWSVICVLLVLRSVRMRTLFNSWSGHPAPRVVGMLNTPAHHCS